MTKGCELCGGVTRMYCESDQASFCWDCDEKVYGANFLVAKHCRSLLCQVCQSPSAWKVSGLKLSHTVSICESCVSVHDGKVGEETQENDVVGDENGYDLVDEDGDSDSDGYSDSEEDDDGDDEEEEELDRDEEVEYDEDGDNQVVSWSGIVVSSPLPPTASSSTSEEYISSRFSDGGGVLKRR